MQAIVLQLIFLDFKQHDLGALSPWLDFRLRPADAVLGMLEAQTHRRCIKLHLPLDGLRYFPQLKYILVGQRRTGCLHVLVEPSIEFYTEVL